MPITNCSLPNGKSGYRWGSSGKCYASKKDAIKQGVAIEGPDKFKKIMQAEGGQVDWTFIKAAIEEYNKTTKNENASAFKSIANYLSGVADDGDNDSDIDKGDMLDENCKADKKDVEIVSDTGNFSGNPKNTGDGLASGGVDSDDYGKGPGNDNDGDESDPEAKAALSDGKPSETAIDTDDPSNNKNGLDSPSKEKTGHVVVPDYNKEASPETPPNKKVPNYEPPTRDDMTPSKSGEAEDPEMTMSEAALKAVSYISQEERDQVAEEDFAGPHKSFPIRNAHDVESAAKLVGHAANPTSVKRKIIEIAKRKGLDHALPSSWKSPDRQVASLYEQAISLFGKLSPEEKKSLADKLEFKEQAVNSPQENN